MWYSSLERSSVARVNEGSLSFTCRSHVYPQMEWAILPLLPSRRASPHFGRSPDPLRVGGWVGLVLMVRCPCIFMRRMCRRTRSDRRQQSLVYPASELAATEHHAERGRCGSHGRLRGYPRRHSIRQQHVAQSPLHPGFDVGVEHCQSDRRSQGLRGSAIQAGVPSTTMFLLLLPRIAFMLPVE